MTLKIIICGSRNFTDWEFFLKKCEDIISKVQYHLEIGASDIEIVSGHADGADLLGERLARTILKSNPKLFPITSADWDDMSPPVWVGTRADGTQYNALAGDKRNGKMATYAGSDGVVIGFVEGKSSGTKNMIKQGKEMGMWTFKIDVQKNKVFEYNSPLNP